MGESVYKIVELVGTSIESWERAAAAAVETASKSLRELRVAEVAELDVVIEDGAVRAYRAKVKSPSSTRTAAAEIQDSEHRVEGVRAPPSGGLRRLLVTAQPTRTGPPPPRHLVHR